ncbi:MAG: TIM barrel protein [Clostridia bacterium]|nr:TIM barrel protein [Clostridia bacterium]
MIRFGPSGNSKDFYDQGFKRTVQAPAWLATMGLTAYEYSFGRGITLSDETAQEIAKQANLYDVQVSVHAPYYINFANPSDEMAAKSYNYVLDSCKKVALLGGERVIFHPASVGKMTRDEAVALTYKRIENLVDKIYLNGMQSFTFCPETMGKINQIGDLAEVVEFCKIDKCLVPTVDFGHLNARTYGSIKTKDDYKRLFNYMLENLGYDKVNKMHVHFSKIEFSKGGEVKHLTFEDTMFGPEFLPLAEVLKQYNLNDLVIICESDGTQAADALAMKNMYLSAK